MRQLAICLLLTLIGCSGCTDDEHSMATHTESFNTSNGDTLGPDLTWTEVTGDIDIDTNAAKIVAANGVARAEHNLDTDEHSAEVVVSTLPANQNAGAGVRFNSSADTALYFVARNAATNTYRLFLRSAGAFTQIGSSVNTTAPSVPFTLRTEIGSDDVLRGFINDVEVISDTPGTLLAGNLRTGFYGTVGVFFDSFEATDVTPPASDEITLDTPVTKKVYQRNGSNQASITITGTYTGTPTAIEARFNGGSWATIDASPSGGTYSGTLSNQDDGLGTLEVRFTNDTLITDSVANIGIGEVFGWFGQSNQSGRFTNGQAFTGAIACAAYDESGGWVNIGSSYKDPDESVFSVLPLLASLLTDELGVPIGFVCQTTGGTGLVTPDANWASGGSQFTAAMSRVASSGINDCRAILWYQGERDAVNGISQSDYQTALSLMLDDMQVDQAALTDSPLIAASIGELGTATSDQVSAIQQAIINRWDNDADIYPGPTSHDQDFSDNTHWTTDGQATILANRWFRCIMAACFAGAETGRGPQFDSATFQDNEITVNLTGGVSPLQNGTVTTGWVVTDSAGARTVSSASSSGLTVTLVCDQALVAPVTLSYADGENAVGDTKVDSGTLATMPIEPFVDASVTPGGSGGGSVFRSAIIMSILLAVMGLGWLYMGLRNELG